MKHYVATAAFGIALAASAVHGDVERKSFEVSKDGKKKKE